MTEALLERKYYPEYLKKNPYYIPGFNVNGEIENLLIHRNALQAEMNIRSYIREYAKQGLVLPNSIDLSMDGKLVNLTGIPIIPGITDEERNGSVLEASIKAESFLAESLPGSMVVITSPMGSSGMRDQKGEMIEYPMTQTLVYWKKDDGHLEGVTLVSDLDKKQNKELLKRLGISEVVLYGVSEMEDLAQIVRNPALLGPNIGLSVDKVVNEILSIRGDSDIKFELSNGEVEYRSVSEYRRDLDRRDKLLKYNQDAEEYIKDFRNFIFANIENLNNDFARERLKEELFKTICKITGTLEEFKEYKMDFKMSRLTRNDNYGYGNEMAFLQTKIGCNGSGNSRSTGISTLRGIGVGGGVISESSGLDGKCKVCGIRSSESGGCGYCEPCAKAA